MTRSLQIVEVDILEQIIEDAKNNRKNLFTAMESVINTMKEVEERGRAADQAREEAAHRSSDVWRRIEELKRMIQSAKEANDMIIIDGMNYDTRMIDHEDGPLVREKLLFTVKSYWTSPASSDISRASATSILELASRGITTAKPTTH
ncbi:hypothetical protein SAY86_005001 [Trapa natans]|uniref:Uncharacterized protein n=1 Tax=Trapa natans TaxID=22666 RepID=A0AAN7QV26_TRANT|nr:hypothetical protein SAY86_005001 [Trapa natans]